MLSQLNTEMMKGMVDLLILSILNGADNYGYEISRSIKLKSQNQFDIPEPTLYLSLKRLENRSILRSYWGTESNGGRRKYYSLTEEGKDQLETLTNEWTEIRSLIDRFI
ncbi:PadR family transcriptional regulator [Paenibacillus apis]|uniref:PadR family transcriptional regulator n=1 Tax=Paenibacillus apis TaxID=1792174 RepID=A0A920CN34_9BACL|nr:PadR family transcriptional regulator [Paenibacillus apis]